MNAPTFSRFMGMALILLATAASPASANDEDRRPVFGEGFGVGIGIESITEAEIKKIASLGIREVRSGFKWAWVESRRGVYDWDRPLPRNSVADGFSEQPTFTYDELVEMMHRNGLHMSMIIGSGNTLYSGPPVKINWLGSDYYEPPAPRTPEAIEAFATFTAATAEHYSSLYGPGAITWLIWNEPDYDPFFPPKADGAIAGHIIETACRKIKETVPQARVMGPALATKTGGVFRYDFVRALFTNANPLNCLDAFTLHPYRPTPPESTQADYAKMADFIAPWQPKNPVPIAVDEWGVPAVRPAMVPLKTWERKSAYEKQAALQLRMYLTNLAAGIPYTAIYEWRDSGPDPDEPEDNYGMNTFTNEEKPAIQMLRYVWPRLSGRILLKGYKPRSCDEHVYLMRFAASSPKTADIMVAWTDVKVDGLRLQGKLGKAFTIFGEEVTPDQSGETRVLPLNGVPLMIDMPSNRDVELACTLPAQ